MPAAGVTDERRKPESQARGTEVSGRRVTLSVGATLGVLGMGQGGYKLARALLSIGADVHVICTGGRPGLLPNAAVDVVRTEPAIRALAHTPLRLRPGLLAAVGNNYFDWRASRLVGSASVFYAYSDQALWSMRAARRRGAVTILHAANTHVDNLAAELQREARSHGALQENWVTPLMVRKIRREYEEADYVRAQSTLVRDSLLAGGVPLEKVLFVPPSVDLSRFRPSSAGGDGVFRVAFVGSFDLRKGIQYLLRAWDEARLPNSQLILHGGVGSRFMKRLLAPYRGRPDIVFRSGDPVPTYARASVCVVPSIEDGFAYVVLEALASGCPVIVSEQVGGKDAVRDGENGFIVPTRDPEAIAGRLAELSADPRRRSEMARAARRTAEAYSFIAEGSALLAALSERGVRIHP